MLWRSALPVFIALVASVATSEAHAERFVAIDMDLPALGTDRRVILSEMRRQGARLADDRGGRLVFAGGPLGWREVAMTTFLFNGTKLEQVEISFDTPVDDAQTRELFMGLRGALLERFGAPRFDRIRDGADEKGAGALALQSHASTWTQGERRAQLVGAYGVERAVKLLVTRHVQADELAEVEVVDDAIEQRRWVAQQSSAVVLQARSAADALLDDFGEQEVVIKGAKQKGAPITVWLRKVKLPKGVQGLSAGVINGRFVRFVDGHWDVDGDQRGADLVLDLEIVPVAAGAKKSYVMRLDAVVARGKDRGKKLYSATQLL